MWYYTSFMKENYQNIPFYHLFPFRSSSQQLCFSSLTYILCLCLSLSVCQSVSFCLLSFSLSCFPHPLPFPLCFPSFLPSLLPPHPSFLEPATQSQKSPIYRKQRVILLLCLASSGPYCLPIQHTDHLACSCPVSEGKEGILLVVDIVPAFAIVFSSSSKNPVTIYS